VAVEWLSRALLLDPMAISGDSACWADARELGMAKRPILLGWRRAGGALVTGTSEGIATRDLWAESATLAESTARWSGERWDAAFRTFWRQAKPPLRHALSERLPLPDDDWTLETWAAAVWGSYAGPVEPPAIAVVGSEVSADVLASVTVASGAGRAAAFVVEPLDAERGRIRCALVAGDLDPGPRRALPGGEKVEDCGDPPVETGALELVPQLERRERPHVRRVLVEGPAPAEQRSRETPAIRRHQQEDALRLEHPPSLAESKPGVGEMFEHVVHHDGAEAAGREGPRGLGASALHRQP